MKKKLRIVFLFVIGLLILSNPGQGRFEQRLAMDYGHSHSGLDLSFNELRRMGHSQYKSYVFFSRFDYAFGSIGVSYLGIGAMVFYIGHHQSNKTENQENETIS